MGILQVGGKTGEERWQVADHRHMVGAAAVNHVLAYDHAKAVAVVIPPGAFYFDMLAQHIKAHLFHDSDVINKSLIRGSSVEPIRPVALIQHAHQKIGFMIETESWNSISFFNGIAAKGKIAFYLVIFVRDLQIIEIGRFRSPGMEVRQRDSMLLRNRDVSVKAVNVEESMDGNFSGVIICLYIQFLYIGGADPFHPHTLPDPALGGIKDPAPL